MGILHLQVFLNPGFNRALHTTVNTFMRGKWPNTILLLIVRGFHGALNLVYNSPFYLFNFVSDLTQLKAGDKFHLNLI